MKNIDSAQPAPLAKSAMRLLLVLLLVTSCCVTFTSCDDDIWSPYPPSGWNTFYDSGLDGKWQLVQANGRPVGNYDTNYMDFYGNGRGMYYYYQNGSRYRERIAYWCQDTYGSSTSRYQINIKYEDGSASTMNYWFTAGGRDLWLQWMTGSGNTVTYVYRAVNYIDW